MEERQLHLTAIKTRQNSRWWPGSPSPVGQPLSDAAQSLTMACQIEGRSQAKALSRLSSPKEGRRLGGTKIAELVVPFGSTGMVLSNTARGLYPRNPLRLCKAFLGLVGYKRDRASRLRIAAYRVG